MVSQKVRVKNPSGLHLRPAGVLCSTALQFKCRVRFTFREATVNAKSVLSVLGACVKEGDEITFECEGEDEDQALATMVKAVEEGGFILAHWDGTTETEEKIKEETKATIRCIPFDSFVPGDKEPGKCMVTGKPSACRVIFARSY